MIGFEAVDYKKRWWVLGIAWRKEVMAVQEEEGAERVSGSPPMSE